MLIDTGSQLTVLSNKWVHQNKKYFKQTAILPVNNINVITAMNKREKVRQQAYVTLNCKDLEITYPMIIMNKLIFDGIIGIDLLNTLSARIDINNNKILCNYKDVLYEIIMNENEENCEVSGKPIVLSKPRIRYAPTQHVNTAEEGMSSQEAVSYTHLDVYKRQSLYSSINLNNFASS